jgi:hypothetical protein
VAAPTRRHAPIVLCPLQFERRRLLRAGLGRLVRVDCCGPGPAAIDRWFNRARSVVSGRDDEPPLVVLAGTAGGLHPGAVAGTAGTVCEVRAATGSDRWIPSRPLEMANGFVVVSTDEVANDPARRQRLREQSGADVVDLESVAFAESLAPSGWPWAIVRGVSDGSADELPAGIERWVDAGGRIRPAVALAGTIRRPGAVRRLRRDATMAMDAVAALLAQHLDEWA